MHEAVARELAALKERYPGKTELSMDDYADCFGIKRHYASRHLRNINKGTPKIAYRRIGNVITIPILYFAYWKAQTLKVDEKSLELPPLITLMVDTKRTRGFCAPSKTNYLA